MHFPEACITRFRGRTHKFCWGGVPEITKWRAASAKNQRGGGGCQKSQTGGGRGQKSHPGGSTCHNQGVLTRTCPCNRGASERPASESSDPNILSSYSRQLQPSTAFGGCRTLSLDCLDPDRRIFDFGEKGLIVTYQAASGARETIALIAFSSVHSFT